MFSPPTIGTKSDCSLYKTNKRTLTGLTLPNLTALTPRDWTVELVDEPLMGVDFDDSVDLMAITSWTINLFQAYDIARKFRDRGDSSDHGKSPHIFS